MTIDTRGSRERFLDRLKECRSATEWNSVCDDVKDYATLLLDSERDGHYPKWWFPDVILSGLMANVSKNWGKSL